MKENLRYNHDVIKKERGDIFLSKRTESPEVMIRRFFREVQLSGILTEAKKRKYREQEPSRRKKRESAKRKSQRNQIKRGW